MDLNDALAVAQDLVDGLDPFTGEVLPGDSPHQRPRVVRALYTVLQHLEPPRLYPTVKKGR